MTANHDWDVPMISGMNAVTPAWNLTDIFLDDMDLNVMRALKEKNSGPAT